MVEFSEFRSTFWGNRTLETWGKEQLPISASTQISNLISIFIRLINVVRSNLIEANDNVSGRRWGKGFWGNLMMVVKKGSRGLTQTCTPDNHKAWTFVRKNWLNWTEPFIKWDHKRCILWAEIAFLNREVTKYCNRIVLRKLSTSFFNRKYS